MNLPIAVDKEQGKALDIDNNPRNHELIVSNSVFAFPSTSFCSNGGSRSKLCKGVELQDLNSFLSCGGIHGIVGTDTAMAK